MTFKEYAQKIMQEIEEKSIFAIDWSGKLECQRARQTAIDLGKMELIRLQVISKIIYEWHEIKYTDIQDGIKDIQEGLKVLGVEA